jgi:hypothetical protein
MGHVIAQTFATAGCKVTLNDIAKDIMDKAQLSLLPLLSLHIHGRAIYGSPVRGEISTKVIYNIFIIVGTCTFTYLVRLAAGIVFDFRAIH